MPAYFAADIDGLRVAIFHEEGAWVAQGLDLDVCSQGASPDDAKRRFSAQLVAEREHAADLSHVPKTPPSVVERITRDKP